jgi:hypothetical protein
VSDLVLLFVDIITMNWDLLLFYITFILPLGISIFSESSLLEPAAGIRAETRQMSGLTPGTRRQPEDLDGEDIQKELERFGEWVL